MRLQKIARTISWVAFIPILILMLCAKINSHTWSLVIQSGVYIAITVNVALLIKKKYISAFMFSIGWLAMDCLLVFGLVFQDPELSVQKIDFAVGRGIWVISAVCLITAAWTCLKAIVEIKKGINNRVTPKQLSFLEKAKDFLSF